MLAGRGELAGPFGREFTPQYAVHVIGSATSGLFPERPIHVCLVFLLLGGWHDTMMSDFWMT